MNRQRSCLASMLLVVLGLAAAPSPAWAADPDQASRAGASLRAVFPELASAPRAPGAPAGAAVDEYIGADVAKLVDSAGRRSVLLSSLPLRSRVGDGTLQPISLALRSGEPGEVRPQNPVAQVRIATDASEGFAIGPNPQHLVTIVPLGLLSDAPPATSFAGQMLFAGARASTDLLVRPSATGVQTFEQLTGEDAPQSFSYKLALTADQTAELADDIVTVRQAGKIVAQSAPPVAVDADHRPVPVDVSLADNVLRLDVPHRDGGFNYPIAVDPDWTSAYDYHDQPGLGQQGWHVSGQVPETPPAYYNAFINNEWDGDERHRDALGFIIKPIGSPGGRFFPATVGAQISFLAPGTTHIRSITFDHVIRLNDRDRQTLRFALYGPQASFKENDDVYMAEELSTATRTLPSVPFPADQDTPATSAVMWMFTSPCDPLNDLNCPPIINSDTSRTLMRVGSVQIVLTDFDYPTTQATGSLRELQDRWTNATDSRTLSPSGIDEGSGVRDLSVSVEDAAGTHPVRSVQSPCHPDHDESGQDSAVCPRTLDLGEPLSLDAGGLREGRSTFTIDASDLADNTAAAGGAATTFSIYLDRNRPETTVAGELYDDADTWIRPRAPSALTVSATDTAGGPGRTSGIAHNLLTAVDSHGATLLDRDADTCNPVGPIGAPCDPGKASDFTVDPRQFPEGPVAFTARSRDLAGNDSDPVSWTVRLDRTPPAARATGDLLALTSQHTSSTTPTSVTLQGRDAASGVARLQLVASNSDGETILVDRDTCAADDIDPTDGACPHNATADVMVNPGDLPDGQTTFIARAIDHAAIRSVDNQDWDTYVDHTPPDPPASVTITETTSRSVQITWPTVVDQPLGSGDVSYEYLVSAGGQPIGGWRPTTNPNAQVGGLPPGVTISVLVRAVDAAKLRSPPRAATKLRRVTAPSAEQIYEREHLALLQKSTGTAVRVAEDVATSSALRASMSRLALYTSRVVGGIFTAITAYVSSDGDLDCEQGAIMQETARAFDMSGRALKAASASLIRRQLRAPALLVEAQTELGSLEHDARHTIDDVDNICNPPARTALNVVQRLSPAIDLALRHTATLEARALPRTRVGSKHCDEARELVRELGAGAGRPNYTVYWSPPPPGAVLYVGISRALDSRCSSHPPDRRRSLETLSLPPLYSDEAHSVEEQLISYFGLQSETAAIGFRPGQLQNQRHSVSPSRLDYCFQLYRGQLILSISGYRSYTVAHFHEKKTCPAFR